MQFINIKVTHNNPSKPQGNRRFIPFTLLMFVVLYAFGDVSTRFVSASCVFPMDSLKTDTLKNDSTKKNPYVLKISKDAPKSKIKYHAKDSCYFDIGSKKLHLVGDAVMEYDNIKVAAAYILVDWNANRVYAYGLKDEYNDSIVGRPLLTVGGDPYPADTLIYDFKSQKGKMKSVRTRQGDGFLYGETVKRNTDESVFMKHGWYTTCDLDHPHFQINISKVKLIPNKQIVTGPAHIVIGDVPTPVFIPFAFFPITKGQRNGFVIPRFSNEESPAGRGFGLVDGGYYFHIKDYADMRVTGSIYSKGSWIGSVSSSYVKRYRFNGALSFNYANNKYGEPHTSEQTVSKQFFVQWNHSIDARTHQGTSFSANVNLSSGGAAGNYLRRNATNNSDFLNNEIRSNISFSKSLFKNKVLFAMNANHSQNTLTHLVNITLPSGQVYVNNIYPFRLKEHVGAQKWFEKINTNYNLQFINSLASNDSTFYSAEQYRTDTLRKYMKTEFMHSIPLRTSVNVLKYINISPDLTLTQRFYFKTIEKNLIVKGNYNGTSDTIITSNIYGLRAPLDYSFGVGMSTRFFGKFNFYHTKLIAIRHTVTPAIGFSYHPDYSLPQYNYYKKIGVENDTTRTRYSYYSVFEGYTYGSPALGRTAAIGFSLGNNFESKWKNPKDTILGTKKIMILEFLNFNSGYNFLADSLKLSPINLSGGTSLFKRVSINFGSLFNPYDVDSFNNTEYNVNRYLVTTTGHKLARMQSASFGFVFSLNSDVLKKKQSNTGSAQELKDVNDHLTNYIDFNIPWNLNFNYNFGYTAPYKLIANNISYQKFRHSLSLSGDLRLTPNWKIAGNIYMDPSKLLVQNVTVDLYRDMHCWDMRINIRPFGENRGFNFSLQAKSALLQDLKISRRFDARFY